MNTAKKILSVILIITVLFSAFAVNVFSAGSNVGISVIDLDYGEICFDVDYPEVGKEMKVSINGIDDEKIFYKWYVNGNQINNNTDSYTPVDDDYQKTITVCIYNTDGEQIGSKSIFVSNLPVIYIDTEDREPIVSKEKELDAAMSIQGNSEYNDPDLLYTGKTKIKGRGNTTWNAAKKPYKLKLDSKSNLFGMGKNKHWVLLSNPYDSSNMRNEISYNLSDKMGMLFQDGVWVELILNGKDVGLYQLVEHVRIGSTRNDITDWEDIAESVAKAIYKKNKSVISKEQSEELIDLMTEDMSWTTTDIFTFNDVSYKISDYYEIPTIDGGYLLEVTDCAENDNTFETDRGMFVEVSKPESLSSDMKDYISGYFQAFENALMSKDYYTVYNGKTMRYTDFIDVESFAKGILVNEIFQNGDFGYKSTFLYKDVNGKLCYGPVWDMDWAYNSSFDSWTSSRREWINRMLNDPVFMKIFRDIYWQYRYNEIQNVIADNGTIDNAYNKIYDAAVHNDEIWGNEIGFESNVKDYKWRVQQKINWLDYKLYNLSSAVPNENLYNSSKITLSSDDNKLSITFNNDEPLKAKVFLGDKLFCEIDSPFLSTEIPVKSSDDVITVVGYDANDLPVCFNYLCNQKYVKSVKIISYPEDKVYYSGESIDLSDFTIMVKYNDKTTEEVTPDLVYSYVKDAIGAQMFSYDKITDECGSAVIVFACQNQKAELSITTAGREDYSLVEEFIDAIPSSSEDKDFIKKLVEAWNRYDSLSEEAKQRVENYSVLSDAINSFNEIVNNSESSVIDCYPDEYMRDNARVNIVVAVKGSPETITIGSNIGIDSTMIFRPITWCVFGIKSLGGVELWTINRGFTSSVSEYSFAASYNGNYDAPLLKSSGDIIVIKKESLKANYPDVIYKNQDFTVDIEADSSVSQIMISEGENIIADTSDFENGITLNFGTEGVHSIKIRYFSDGKWNEISKKDILVREEPALTESMLYNSYNGEKLKEDTTVRIVTSTEINEISYSGNNSVVEFEYLDKNGFRIWTGNLAAGAKYAICVNGASSGGRVKNVSIDDVEMYFKDSAKINPIITIDEGTEYTVNYSTSDSSVLTVDNNGSINTLKTGAAEITCTVTDEYGNTTEDTCTVNIYGRVKNVSIDDIEMYYRDSATIKPVINMDEGTEYTVSYYTSDLSVLTVDKDGNITTHKTGSAQITCIVTDKLNKISEDTCTVTVKGKAKLVVINDVVMYYKGSEKIIPTIEIDDDTDYTVTYSTSDSSVVTIDNNGSINTLKIGAAEITCKVTDEYGNIVEDTCTVTIYGRIKNVSIDDIEMYYKDSATIKPVINMDEGTEYTVSYYTSDSSVLTVDKDGNITTHKTGSAQVTCKVTDKLNKISEDTCTVIVKGKAKSVAVNDVVMYYKGSEKITPTIEIDDDTDYTVTYSTSDSSVMTVDKDGNILTHKKGNAQIVCTVTDEHGNTQKDTCNVTVKFSFGQWLIWILLLGFLWY